MRDGEENERCDFFLRRFKIEQRKWDLISDFIVENLHSDSPQFRQNMQAHAKIFLLRVLENSLSYVKSKPSDKYSPL